MFSMMSLDPHDLYPMPTPTKDPIMFVKFEKDMVERIHTANPGEILQGLTDSVL